MNTKIIAATVAVAIAAGGGALYISASRTSAPEGSACASACRQASQACPSLVNEGNCIGRCDRLSEETRRHLEAAATCEQLSARPDLIADLVLPGMDVPQPSAGEPGSECEAACGSYVSKCLTLVPNASQALFDEGLSSCMAECADWDAGKVECMVNAFDCEAMTNVCGL